MQKKKKSLLFLLLLFCCCMLSKLHVWAGTIYDSSYVSFAPDGKAWTVQAGDRDYTHYELGTEVETEIGSGLRTLEMGEHYYNMRRTGSVPIRRWVVEHGYARCIHDNQHKGDYHGLKYGVENCLGYYNSGWVAYCADCGEKIRNMYVYMDKEAAESIDFMECGVDMDYFHLCPHCNNLEQGVSVNAHICKQISWNRYRIVYDANAQFLEAECSGYMNPSFHMYNNAKLYNGNRITPITHLTKNAYSCVGYKFLGWNTEPDGSGVFYEDGAEIYNLTAYEYSVDKEAATVTLYAQWEKSQSTLRLDANGGRYLGRTVYAVTQGYGSQYRVETGLLVAPQGYRVDFEENGGSEVASITTVKNLSHWEQQTGFAGIFRAPIFFFTGEEGSISTLVAQYVNKAFVLPESKREDSSLVGWYNTASLEDESFVGKPGDEVVVDDNTTLYAKWADLTLWTYDDYSSNGGVGAVDLKWEQKDNKEKSYKLFQSRDKEKWNLLYAEDAAGTCAIVSESFGIGKQGASYRIEHTGYYILTANGAQGADYNSIFVGGKGGSVSATYWLKKGDILTFYAGESGNGTAGGSNGNNANGGASKTSNGRGGGAASEIYITRNGKKTLLLLAGGGGGANKEYAGGDGGRRLTEVGSKMGASADFGGGGGGAQGGISGSTKVTTTPENTVDFAFRSDLSENLDAGTTQLFGASKEGGYTASFLPFTIGAEQFEWRKINEMGVLSSDFQTSYEYWDEYWDPDGDDATHHFSTKTGNAEVGGNPYIYAHIDGGLHQTLQRNYQTNGNTNLIVGGGIYRVDNGAPGKNYLYLTVTDVDTGRILYDKQVGFLYSNAYAEWDAKGIAVVENIDVSSAANVNVKITSSTEGTQGGRGYEVQTYISDIIFYGKQVANAQPAEGGSSYINTGFGCKNQSYRGGSNSGDGYIKITSKDNGYLETTALCDVEARDLAAPRAVQTEGVIAATGKQAITMEPMENSDGNIVKVYWTEPEDKGTLYYHMAESYLTDTGEKISTSNITENTLATGVKGYYYRIDASAVTQVTNVNSVYVGKEDAGALVTLKDIIQYLHIAPVDGAGNIGPTSHVSINSKKNIVARWPLHTREITIEEGDNVYQAGNGSWYVRADEATPFTLQFEAYQEGNATITYQINQTIFQSCAEGAESARSIIETPMTNISAGSIVTEAEGLSFANTGAPVIKNDTYSKTIRSNFNREIRIINQFLLGAEMHGKWIHVIPRAGVVSSKYNIYSDYDRDEINSIYLIGDAEAPAILGMEILDGVQMLDRNQGTFVLNLAAEDGVSGVRDFYAEIYNSDNTISRIYESDENGNIQIELTAELPIFSGDFSITVTAVDNVGNERTLIHRMSEFALDTKVERILAPHEPKFKRGESGILTITAWGYVEKVEVEFPQKLTDINPELNRTYVYEIPRYRQEEKLQFMIPLYAPYGDDYAITVRAYKGDKNLESYPELNIIKVEGTILDEIRTRLR